MPDNDIFLQMAEAELDAGYNDWLETLCQCERIEGRTR